METTGPETTLRDIVRVLRRRKWLVVAATVVAISVALMLSLTSTKIYAADADVIAQSAQEGVFTENPLFFDPTVISTHIELIKSQPLAREAANRLGDKAAGVSGLEVSAIGDTRVIRITVESSNPAIARDAATTYAQVFVDQRRKAAVDNITAIGRQLVERAAQAKTQLDDLDNRIARAEAARNNAELDSLRTERATVAQQYTLYQQRADQSQVDAPLQRGGVEVLAEASLPVDPVRPTPVRTTMLAAIVGLLIGIASAFAVEYVDDSIKNADDLERHARGLSVLGSIPAIADWRDHEKTRLISVENPTSPVSEAYRSLRTSLQFITLRQPLRTVVITSPMAAEGKTTTLSNLAVTMARAGRRVICVDCDLRRPRLHQFFGVDHNIGFTSVLLGDQPLSAALQTVPISGGGSLRLLASGPLPPNPAELLGTGRVTELINSVANEADIVLIDVPPLLPVTDAVVLSGQVDGVLLVATSRVTGRRLLSKAVDLLNQAEASTVGIVLNGASEDEAYGYSYRYRYRYKDRSDNGGRARQAEPAGTRST